MQSTIRLFKALPIPTDTIPAFDNDLMSRTIPSGFIFAPEVIAAYPDTKHLIELVDKAYGRNPEQLNQSFHKSWNKVKTAPIEQLFIEQVVHYFTTYGLENIGIYNQDTVYIPAETLDVPALDEGVRLVVIKGLTKDELKDKLLHFVGSGVALAQTTIDDVIDVATFVELSPRDISLIKNKEVKAALYDYFGIVPRDPTEFLRYIVYRATNKTLLIKNKAQITELKERNNVDLIRYFDLYEKEHGLHQLAQIFYRYKPLFLALRTNTQLRKSINRIRRLAVANHKPMKSDLLNNVTAILAGGNQINLNNLAQALEQATVFRKIRLAYALKFRTTEADAILYRIRNGKSYAKQFHFTHQDLAAEVYTLVLASIVADVSQNVADKTIYIPEDLKYGLPATEKQFTGNFPSGTYVDITQDMVAGIHWENQGPHRIDLDLSIQDAYGKLGWDAEYRSSEGTLLFSGDITDAPKPEGASEYFYIDHEARGAWLMNVNYYNYQSEVPVPFQIVVAHEKPLQPTRHYTVDANKIVAQSTTTMDVKQKVLGVIVATDKSCKFYFAESNMGAGRTAGLTTHADQARRFLLNFYTDSIVLNDVLTAAGATIVTQNSPEVDLDLSPESIDKTTILSLLQASTNA